MPTLAGAHRPVLLAAAACLLAACSTLPNPLVTAAPPDALHPNPQAVSTPTPTAVPEKLTELQRQRRVWSQAGILSYRLRLLFGCECKLGGKTVDVTVRRGEVADASIAGVPLDLAELVGVPATVEQLFDYAERSAGAAKDELKYDTALGYPQALGVDPDPNNRDDDIRIVVLELDPGR
jgi:starvation-inducible outer membrane lipoprotein